MPILCSKTPPPWGGGLKISKPRGPMGWGIQNFKTPGSPWGGGFEIPWGIPNTSCQPGEIKKSQGKVYRSLYRTTRFGVKKELTLQAFVNVPPKDVVFGIPHGI